MRELLIATRNEGKVPEIKAKLDGLGFKFLTLDDVDEIPDDFDVEETGDTFEENAVLKAKTYGEMSGLLTLADDSGLEVEALGGAPGVSTARYAPGTDKDRYMKLLSELEGVVEKERGARFVAVVAVFYPESKEIKACRGVQEGWIVREPVGTNGFGYDPVFFNPELGKTEAQMTLEEKNLVSHRGKAIAKMREILCRSFKS